MDTIVTEGVTATQPSEVVNGVNGHHGEDIQMTEGETAQQQSEQQQPPPPTLPPTNGTTHPQQFSDFSVPRPLASAPTPQASMPVKEVSKDASPARASTPMFGLAIPEAHEHGSPTRVYMNTKVGPVLLEGMKWVAKHEPEKPLKWLAEFLAKRSRELEGE